MDKNEKLTQLSKGMKSLERLFKTYNIPLVNFEKVPLPDVINELELYLVEKQNMEAV